LQNENVVGSFIKRIDYFSVTKKMNAF